MIDVRCSSCGSAKAREFFVQTAMPVHVCQLWPSSDAARACPRGDIHLAYCEGCGFIANRAFRPALVAYAENYENSLHFSEFFQGYIREYAQDLIERYQLRDKLIVEIGCGDGEFLRLLCRLGGNRGVGFDPSHEPAENDADRDPRVTIIPEYYSPKRLDTPADLIVCRQVFEHLPNPREFLEDLRARVDGHRDTVLEFEVPNASYTLDTGSLWDVIYEHCSYFSRESLRNIFSLCGFEVLQVSTTYENQFLSVGARPGRKADAPVGEGLKAMAEEVRRFGATCPRRVTAWRERLQTMKVRGRRVALWGAGARGVSFLNMVGVMEEVGEVVDINPRKHGAYLPGTGHRVSPPQALKDFGPDLVIIMNPLYKPEIGSSLRAMGLSPEVCVA